MNKFKTHKGIVAPFNRANIDTDAIIPKQFLKSIKKSGFGDYLFDEWRFLDKGEIGKKPNERTQNEDFILNKEEYKEASILLASDNFGCGSSREHAVWALDDYGFRAVIAPSFADIFYNNCFKNGVLPIALEKAEIDKLFIESNNKILELTIDLEKQKVFYKDDSYHFDIDPFRKHCMLEGLDTISLTLKSADKIKSFENEYQKKFPWVF